MSVQEDVSDVSSFVSEKLAAMNLFLSTSVRISDGSVRIFGGLTGLPPGDLSIGFNLGRPFFISLSTSLSASP